MAQAADYFLAAMDRYEEARNRKQERAMQQEQHALYMKNGLMQLDAFSKQQAALEQSANYIEGGRASLDGLPQQASPAQQPQQQPQQQQQPQPQPQQPLAEAVPVPAHPAPSFDSSALQRTLGQMSGYMGDFNAARGNSGFGTALSMHRQSDGSYIIGAANPEQNGAYPLTVNPQDNGSMPLRVAPETVGPMQQYVQGRIDATGGDPAKMAALARDQFGLRHDEQGNIYVPTPDLGAAPAQPQAQVQAKTPPPAVTAATPTPPVTPGTSTGATTKVRFSTKVNDDPQAFHAMAQSPHLDVGPADEKVLGKVEADPFHLATSPASVRGKTAALFLRAGLLNGEQALNMAQTGYTNMNKAQLAETLARINLTSTQLKEAEHRLALDLRFGSAERQAGLDNTYASIDAHRASKRASEATAEYNLQMRQNALADKQNARLKWVNDNVKAGLNDGFAAFGGKNELPADTSGNLKPQYVNAVASALEDTGLQQTFATNAKAATEAQAIYTRMNNLQQDPKAQETLRARGVDPTDVNQVAQYVVSERYAPAPAEGKAPPAMLARPGANSPRTAAKVGATPDYPAALSVKDRRDLAEKNQKFVENVVAGVFIGADNGTGEDKQKKDQLKGKAQSWGASIRKALKANSTNPNTYLASESAVANITRTVEHMKRMNVGFSQDEIDGAAVYAQATALAGMDSTNLDSTWQRDKALLKATGVDLTAFASEIRKNTELAQQGKLDLKGYSDVADYTRRVWLEPLYERKNPSQIPVSRAPTPAPMGGRFNYNSVG